MTFYSEWTKHLIRAMFEMRPFQFDVSFCADVFGILSVNCLQKTF